MFDLNNLYDPAADIDLIVEAQQDAHFSGNLTAEEWKPVRHAFERRINNAATREEAIRLTTEQIRFFQNYVGENTNA